MTTLFSGRRSLPPPPPDLTAPAPVADSDAAKAIRDGAIFGELQRQLSATKSVLIWIASQPIGRELHMPQCERAFKDIAHALKFATPYAECPYWPNCSEGCKACRGSRWITKAVYDALPPELKQ